MSLLEPTSTSPEHREEVSIHRSRSGDNASTPTYVGYDQSRYATICSIPKRNKAVTAKQVRRSADSDTEYACLRLKQPSNKKGETRPRANSDTEYACLRLKQPSIERGEARPRANSDTEYACVRLKQPSSEIDVGRTRADS